LNNQRPITLVRLLCLCHAFSRDAARKSYCPMDHAGRQDRTCWGLHASRAGPRCSCHRWRRRRRGKPSPAQGCHTRSRWYRHWRHPGNRHSSSAERRARNCNRLCVQRRLVCSAGIKPAGAKVRRPVAWMAGWRETETLKPIDKVSLGEITSHRAVMRVNAKWPRKQMNPGAEPANEGRRQHGMPKSDRCGILISAG